MIQSGGSWFSARVRLVAFAEGRGATHQMECIHVFRGADWDAAFQRALELGRSHEEEYVNADGALVRWRLAEVVSLDMLRSDDLDGAEVYSEISDIPPGGERSAEIAPERSQPTQTL